MLLFQRFLYLGLSVGLSQFEAMNATPGQIVELWYWHRFYHASETEA